MRGRTLDLPKSDVDLTFLAPSTARPVGGALAIHEFANGMARRQHDITLAHLPVAGGGVVQVDDDHWSVFEPTIRHIYPRSDLADLPKAEFVFCFDDRLPEDVGLPLMWVQALGIFDRAVDTAVLSAPAPKLCVSQWLRRALLLAGVPEVQAIHVPYGLDHDRFHPGATSPERDPIISMLVHPHITKAAGVGIDALRQVTDAHPDVRVELFSTFPEPSGLPDGFVFHPHLQGAELADLYRRSLIFLTSAVVEGFGFAPVEAMACGAALVSSVNGGCDDYAIHEETALIGTGYGPAGLVEQLCRLLDDRRVCARIAGAGEAFCRRFHWDRSAELLERILLDYAADPAPRREPIAVVAPTGRELMLQVRGALPV